MEAAGKSCELVKAESHQKIESLMIPRPGMAIKSPRLRLHVHIKTLEAFQDQIVTAIHAEGVLFSESILRSINSTFPDFRGMVMDALKALRPVGYSYVPKDKIAYWKSLATIAGTLENDLRFFVDVSGRGEEEKPSLNRIYRNTKVLLQYFNGI